MSHKLTTQSSIERHIAKGHGKGRGPLYTPWHEVRHITASGTSSRILGWKTGRQHSLFSRLELQYFYNLEWAEAVVDIREQFPLMPRAATEEICDRIGIGHPMEVGTSINKIITTDFLITTADSREHARTVINSGELNKPRVLERLEIEHLYWAQQGIEWRIVTEYEINKHLSKNVEWIHTMKHLASLSPMTEREVRAVRRVLEPQVVARHHDPLVDICLDADDRIGLPNGSSLSVLRHLLANRIWECDMLTSQIDPKKPLTLKVPTDETASQSAI